MARGVPRGNDSKPQVIVNDQSKALLEQLSALPFTPYMKFLPANLVTHLERLADENHQTLRGRNRANLPLNEQRLRRMRVVIVGKPVVHP